MIKYGEGGLEALMDQRLAQASHRCAPVDEVMQLTEQYRGHYSGWNVKHFHTWYRKDAGMRSYKYFANLFPTCSAMTPRSTIKQEKKR